MVFQERTYSVLIVTASDSFTAKIMPLLPVTDNGTQHWRSAPQNRGNSV